MIFYIQNRCENTHFTYFFSMCTTRFLIIKRLRSTFVQFTLHLLSRHTVLSCLLSPNPSLCFLSLRVERAVSLHKLMFAHLKGCMCWVCVFVCPGRGLLICGSGSCVLFRSLCLLFLKPYCTSP